MLCPNCMGARFVYAPVDETSFIEFRIPCWLCGGHGVINCCEGEVAHLVEQAAQPPVSATANRPTGLHDPTF